MLLIILLFKFQIKSENRNVLYRILTLFIFFIQESTTLKVRTGSQKKPPGFQAQLVCLTPWNNGEPPSHIKSLTINSSYGL